MSTDQHPSKQRIDAFVAMPAINRAGVVYEVAQGYYERMSEPEFLDVLAGAHGEVARSALMDTIANGIRHDTQESKMHRSFGYRCWYFDRFDLLERVFELATQGLIRVDGVAVDAPSMLLRAFSRKLDDNKTLVNTPLRMLRETAFNTRFRDKLADLSIKYMAGSAELAAAIDTDEQWTVEIRAAHMRASISAQAPSPIPPEASMPAEARRARAL